MEKYSRVERWDLSPQFACCSLSRLPTVTVLLMQTPVCKKNPFFFSRPGGKTWWYMDESAFEPVIRKVGGMKGSGYPVSGEYLFLREKTLIKVQQYFHAMKLQILLLSKKRREKGLLKAFKNNKKCLFNKCSFACLPTAQTILSRTVICLGFPMLNKTSTKYKFENRLKTLLSLAANSPAHRASAQG